MGVDRRVIYKYKIGNWKQFLKLQSQLLEHKYLFGSKSFSSEKNNLSKKLHPGFLNNAKKCEIKS